MESSKEKIEAQLCAYVEGELDDAQRAEIEQHLAANPHHQALIAELRAASGLLRDLPRVKAPVELNESLCGQLERSALLDPNEDAYDRARTGNRWPQFTAVAAVLILAAGLAFVVFYVLPPSGGAGHNQVAIDNKGLKNLPQGTGLERRESAADTGEKLSELKEKDADRSPPGEVAAPATDQAKRVVKMAAPAAPRALATGTGVRMRDSNDDLNVARLPNQQRGMVTAAEVENVRKWMNESLGADNTFFKQGGGNSLYLVVSTPNTAAANGQLSAYFKTNGIQYMEDDTRLPALGRAALADAGGVKSEPVVRRSGSAGVVAESNKDSETDKSENTPAPGGVAAGGVRGGASELALGSNVNNRSALSAGRETRDFRLQPEGLKKDMGAAKAPETPAAPDFAERKVERAVTDATAPATPGKPVAEEQARSDGNELSRANGAAGQNQLGQVAEERGAGRPMVIVARMNRRQVNELSVSLSRQEGQRAELKEFAPAVAGETLQHATTGAVSSLNAHAGGEPSPTTPLDPGSLTLDKGAPQANAKPVPATLADSAAAVKAKGEVEQKLQPPEGFGATVATTAPVNGTLAAPAPVAAAGSEALRLSVDPLDEPVDVVIVVKKESGPAPTTAPKPQIDGAP